MNTSKQNIKESKIGNTFSFWQLLNIAVWQNQYFQIFKNSFFLQRMERKASGTTLQAKFYRKHRRLWNSEEDTDNQQATEHTQKEQGRALARADGICHLLYTMTTQVTPQNILPNPRPLRQHPWTSLSPATNAAWQGATCLLPPVLSTDTFLSPTSFPDPLFFIRGPHGSSCPSLHLCKDHGKKLIININ